jgi:hypothetical protein
VGHKSTLIPGVLKTGYKGTNFGGEDGDLSTFSFSKDHGLLKQAASKSVNVDLTAQSH